MLFSAYTTSNLSPSATTILRKLCLQRAYYAEPARYLAALNKGVAQEDGFLLLTNAHASRLWNIPVRTLERGLSSLVKAGYILLAHRGERAQRYVKLLPPQGKTAERQLSLFAEEEKPPVMDVVYTVQSAGYVSTGTGVCYFSTAISSHSSAMKSGENGGAGPTTGGTGGGTGGGAVPYNNIENKKDNTFNILPSFNKERTDGEKEISLSSSSPLPQGQKQETKIISLPLAPSPMTPVVAEKAAEVKNAITMENYKSTDPVLESLNSHKPFQTDLQAVKEAEHLVRLHRLRHLKMLPGLNPLPLKNIFRDHRTAYDKDRRNLTGDHFGFYGTQLRDYYCFLDRAAEYLLHTGQGLDAEKLASWIDAFLLTVRLNQRTFTVSYVLNNFVDLIKMNEQIQIKEQEELDGIKRTGYKKLNDIEGVFDDLPAYKATFDKYTEMRRAARLNLDTSEHTWDGRNITLLLQMMDNVAQESWRWIEKQDDQRQALKTMFLLVVQKWQHYPRWSPFIFAQRWAEVMAVIHELKEKAERKEVPKIPMPKADSVRPIGDILKKM